jgi:hypothetical protein
MTPVTLSASCGGGQNCSEGAGHEKQKLAADVPDLYVNRGISVQPVSSTCPQCRFR